MPGSRHKILSHVFSGFSEKMGRTKVLEIGAQAIETPLKRCLTTFDITLLGKYITQTFNVITFGTFYQILEKYFTIVVLHLLS